MQVSATANANAAAQAQANSSNDTFTMPTQIMSQQDFLNLLVTQMTAQDPLNPMTNQDMLAQMVQFSTLQANTNLQSNLVAMQIGQEFQAATALIGREVNLQVDASSTTQGVVSGVDVSSGLPEIVVNGVSYGLGQVLSVTSPTN
jgi:flagellar basal-body rod modification protein FlgD